MTTETTEATSDPIGWQRPAVQALADLIDLHPALPEAHITIHVAYKNPAQIGLQLETPQDFEQWRSALGIDPADVTLHVTVGNSWLAADAVRESTRVHITGFGVLLAAETGGAS